MKEILVNKLLLLLLFVSHTAFASCSTTEDKYMVGFFNGVWNSEKAAIKSRIKLRKATLTTSYKGNTIKYKLFYNQSSGFFSDIAETFMQRDRELDGALSDKWEFYWEGVLQKRKDEGQFLPELRVGLEKMLNVLTNTVLTGMSYALSNPPTKADYNTHNEAIEDFIEQGYKMLFVAHSQGNEFVIKAYDNAVSLDEDNKQKLKVVHIAPASLTLRGKYILGNVDMVINGLKAFGVDTVNPSNVDMLISFSDLSGHTLANTYLNPDREALPIIQSLVKEAMDDLLVHLIHVDNPHLNISLTWKDDVALHLVVQEPDRGYSFFGVRDTAIGHLSVNDNAEVYTTTSESGDDFLGLYSISRLSFTKELVKDIELSVSIGECANITQTFTILPDKQSALDNGLFDLEIIKSSSSGYDIKMSDYTGVMHPSMVDYIERYWDTVDF